MDLGRQKSPSFVDNEAFPHDVQSSHENPFETPLELESREKASKKSVDVANVDEGVINPELSLSGHHGFNDTVECQPVSKRIWALAASAGIGGLLFGYDTGVISGALVVIGNSLGKTITDGDKEYITSSTSLGALIGGITAGALADFLGRKPVIAIASIIVIIGSIVQVTAHSLWHMIGGRFVIGIGVGLASLIVPLYLSELAPSKIRGRLVIVYVFLITLGQVIAYGIDTAFEHVKHGWRWMVGLAIVPAFFQLVILVWLPESPRLLIKKEKAEKAYNTLASIYPTAHPYEIQTKLHLIQEGVRDPFSGTRLQKVMKTLKELYFVPSNFRALILACSLQALQQLSGFNSLMYFSSTIFQTVGFDNPTATGLIIAGTNFVFTIAAFSVIDRFGRRLLLLVTLLGMIAALIVCAVAFHFLPRDKNGNFSAGQSNPWAIVILISMIVYVASYASGLGNLPWQQSELFPMSVRGLGTGMATAVNWASNLAIGATFLTLMNKITPTGTFALYGGLCAAGWVMSYFCYPEFADYTIEEISILLKDGFGVKESMEHLRRVRQEHAWSREDNQTKA
ncbi:myo-inositol transporter Itr1 [Schizosaccharomyces cryophilus OY26]|uniref:Myo-inositol transporter Itr1 n=1 Tax=Schizosaccharomyces cryophilus (strain OY26 / ATCC MYA-4695 / CBS 11777 / NBRC 106824 / NRRL Y48691) TaxID=653667 RepID=S9XFM1_SCHCR|nr:myo-inositol transporter Itr1 [Schizosaccharomyces cryophilus OY26]EPY52436.1 myo-inositol transporter Itr1 [Schizosaccharomyces cryophilus OY26]